MRLSKKWKRGGSMDSLRRFNNSIIANTCGNKNYAVDSGVARDYLATINNQSDILTKTPDKTMKIVYTLREE